MLGLLGRLVPNLVAGPGTVQTCGFLGELSDFCLSELLVLVNTFKFIFWHSFLHSCTTTRLQPSTRSERLATAHALHGGRIRLHVVHLPARLCLVLLVAAAPLTLASSAEFFRKRRRLKTNETTVTQSR